MTVYPPFRRVEVNARFGELAAQLSFFLAALWLLCAPSQGWSAAPAPVTIVDVMALYTPAARAEAGGTGAITAQIELAFAEANFVFENSRANLRARLVHHAEISYAESGSVPTLRAGGFAGFPKLDTAHC